MQKEYLSLAVDFIEELLSQRKYATVREQLVDMEPADVALLLSEFSEEQLPILFRLLPKELAAETFVEMDNDQQELLIRSFSDTELQEVLEEMYLDDTVDVIEEMPASVVHRILRHCDPESRKTINELMKYPEDSAGSIMTAEYVGLKQSMTVEQAFAYIRKNGVDKETIYTCYVMDEKRRLEGVVTVKDLLMNPYEEVIGNIMDTHVIKAFTTEDQEEVADSFQKYDLLSLPVVDHEERLVGIVTVDDVVDVMEQEATEDFEKMAAMLPSEKPYLKTGVFQLAKNRIAWLLILMVSSMITGGILAKYEAAFAVIPLLVTFIPMLTDTGGNAGSQSSTMIIRGMAVGEIEPGDLFKVLWKELRVGVIVGVILGFVNYVRLVILYPGREMLCLTVVLSLMATVIIAKTIGCMLPIAAKVFHMDPAIMASPLITTLVDTCSILIYFNIATRIFQL